MNSPITTTPAPRITHWQMSVGTICLWIIGPGPDAMCRASRSYYTGRIGSDHERAIAMRAVILLDRSHKGNADAGEAEINAALAEAARQIRKGLPAPPAVETASSSPRPPKSLAPHHPAPTEEDARRIIAAVEYETQQPGAAWTRLSTQAHGRDKNLLRARNLCIHAAVALFPRTGFKDLDCLFAFPQSCFSNTLRNARDVIRKPPMSTQLASILERLQSPA